MPLDLTGSAYNHKPTQRNDAQVDNAKKGKPSTQITFITDTPKYQMADLILDHPVKEALLDAVAFYKYQDIIFNRWGLYERYKERLSLTINLYGESGTGKTMAAHAIAHELCKRVLLVDYAEIESKYVGETSKNIRALFNYASENDAVIVFDEADALLSKRVTEMRSSTDVSVNQTRSVLLNILNDYQGVVVFTTNFIQNFDFAFMRRIRYQIKFDLPNEDLRLKLWQMYIPPQMPITADLHYLAQTFAGISGSDISNAVFSAAIRAARNGENSVQQKYFEDAITTIVKAKRDNSHENVQVRKVSEEYVKEQIGLEEK